MNKLLQLFIRIYWLIPQSKRRRCLFKESCSHYVYKISAEQGFKKAIEAFNDRRHQCRPNYSFYKTEDETEWVILADASIVKRSETIV